MNDSRDEIIPLDFFASGHGDTNYRTEIHRFLQECPVIVSCTFEAKLIRLDNLCPFVTQIWVNKLSF